MMMEVSTVMKIAAQEIGTGFEAKSIDKKAKGLSQFTCANGELLWKQGYFGEA